MKITLAPGEKLHIDFAETDGEFVIHFDTKEFPNAVVVEESADCKPSLVGTTGIIYHDAFPFADPGDVDAVFPNVKTADDLREHSSEVDVDVDADFPNVKTANDPLTECARNEELGRRESLDADDR